MDSLFGVPIDSVLLGLLGLTGITLAVFFYAVWRWPVIARLGIRNLPRRPMQSALIVLGLILGSAIATVAFATGDTLAYSLRSSIADALGSVDEVISPFQMQDFNPTSSGQAMIGLDRFTDLGRLDSIPLISQAQYDAWRADIRDDPSIDGFAPILLVPGVIRDTTSGQTEPIGFTVGLGPEYEQQFGLHATDGRPVAVGSLKPGVSGLVRGASSLLDVARGLGIKPSDVLTNALSRLAPASPGAKGWTGILSALDPAQTTSVLLGLDRILEPLGLELRRADAYLSQEGAQSLAAHVGDELYVMFGPIPIPMRVKDIVVDVGPLAPFGPVVVVPTGEIQSWLGLLGLGDRYLAIAVSNRGGTLDSIQYSQAVTDRLRLLLLDRSAALELANLLRSPGVRAAIQAEAQYTPDRRPQLQDSVSALQRALLEPGLSDDLGKLLSDPELAAWLGTLPLSAETHTQLEMLTERSIPLKVTPVKAFALQQADLVASGTTFLLVFANGFSVLASILLIFLVFVMLAASRKSEMGVARAIGTQRRHLVLAFVAEGAAYGAAASALGVAWGVGITYVAAGIISATFARIGGVASMFRIAFHVEPSSLLIGFCLGLLFTLAVVAFAAWYVSRLNIVAAIRDLPEASAHPRRRSRFGRMWLAGRGLLLLTLGVATTWGGFVVRQESPILVGISLVVMGAGMTVNRLLRRAGLRSAVCDRLTYSASGIGLVLVWAIPWATLSRAMAVNRDGLASILGGILMVAGMIWTVMENADLLMRLANWLLRGNGPLAPALRLATTYPLNAPVRTGMTTAMFAVVILLVVSMAIGVKTQQEYLNRNGGQMAGFDIQATTTLPIQDLRAAIQDHPELRAADFVAYGWTASLPAESRQVDATASSWSERYPLLAVDAGFIEQAQVMYPLAMRAAGYATDQDVWRALSERDDVVVVPPRMVPRPGARARQLPGYLEGIQPGGSSLPSISLELRQANVPNAAVARFQVIAVLEQENTAAGTGILANPSAIERLTGSPAKPAKHFVKLQAGVDAQAVASQMEQAFQVYGMDARTAENVNPVVREVAASLTMMQGFVALGLLIGMAALGVISSRNVVERRQQIGVLRALGFQPGMVALSFMLESGFVSFLGILIGVALGIVLSMNMLAEAGRGEGGLTLSVPWVQIAAITLAACVFSLITTIIPAYQAARIRPAEALRYE